jgi:O-antigen/teichoic acid export membrane protein
MSSQDSILRKTMATEISIESEYHRYAGISAKRLARNSVINFTGQLAVGLGALVCLPITIRNLGADRYGLIAIVFVLLGSFTLVELGLGRATTRFVSAAFGEGRYHDVPPLVLTSSLLQAGIGVLIGALLACASSPIVATLHLSQGLIPDARVAVMVLAACAPFVLASSSLRGALEGAQCFGAVNAVKCTVIYRSMQSRRWPA